MNPSELFIRRPVATTLLTIAIAIAGAVAYTVLPVSPLPQVDFPTISVSGSLPGASAQIMASSVATPLERQFGHIAGVSEMTSASSLGSTSITIQFDLSRNIDGAARDVEAAISAARTYLPANLPANPTYRKVNPADAPIMIIGLTSSKYDRGKLYDEASTVISQKLSQIQGVGQVSVGGSSLPSVRIDVNPTQLNNYGLTLANVQGVLSTQNADIAKGQMSDGAVTADIIANDQISTASDYKPIVIGHSNGAAVRLSDVAASHRRRSEHPFRRVSERNTFGHGDHLPPAGREHHPDRRQYSQPVAISESFDSPGHRHHHRSRPNHHNSGLG